jgi:uncharacterized membrane protein YidH (DUF202 family)
MDPRLQHNRRDQPAPGLSEIRSHVQAAPEGSNGGELTHPLLAAAGESVLDLMGDSRASVGAQSHYEDGGRVDGSGGGGGDFFGNLRRKFFGGGGGGGGPRHVPRTIPMKIEPKTFFANERTFLSWLHTAVLLGTIGAGLASFHISAKTRETNSGSASSGSASGAYNGSPESRVLTIVHRHEYRVHFPLGAGMDGGMAGFSPTVTSSGAGDSGGDDGAGSDQGTKTSVAVEEAVSRAIVSYFENFDGASSAATNASSSGARLGASSALQASVSAANDTGVGSSSMAPLMIAMTMLSASVLLCIYATWTFVWRGRMIAKRSTVPFHDPIGPVVMGCIMIGSMLTLITLTAVKGTDGM